MNIRAEREAAGISQAELARRIGMLQPKLSRIENGHIEATVGEEALIRTALDPQVSSLIETVGEILGDEDEPAILPHCLPYPAAPSA